MCAGSYDEARGAYVVLVAGERRTRRLAARHVIQHRIAPVKDLAALASDAVGVQLLGAKRVQRRLPDVKAAMEALGYRPGEESWDSVATPRPCFWEGLDPAQRAAAAKAGWDEQLWDGAAYWTVAHAHEHMRPALWAFVRPPNCYQTV